MSEHDTNLIEEAKKAVVELNKGFEEFKATNDERMKALEGKGVDPLLEDKLSKIEADLDKAQKVADEAVLAAKRQARVVTDEKGNEIDLDAKALKWAKSVARKRGTDLPEYNAADMQGYKAAFHTYLRKDDKAMLGEEAKALSVGSDPDGGYVVHPDMSGRIVKREFETSPMRAYASVQVIGTSELVGLRDDDEAGAGWVEETASRSETTTPDLGRYRIPVHEMYANPAATQTLLDDAEIDVEGWLANKVAERFARIENAGFVNGSGVGQPRGFLTYADWAAAGTYEVGAIEQFDTGVNGGFDTPANDGADVLFDAVYGLKARYRMNANWFMNRATTKMVRVLKDSDDNYLWAPGIAVGQPATLVGYGIASFEDMPDPNTGTLSMAFGDMRSAYQIVDRMGIRVLRDPYTNKPYVHFYSTKRVGGDVVDFDALKLINFKS